MVDAALGRRIELTLGRCAAGYARAHRARFPQHGAEVLELGSLGSSGSSGSSGADGLAVWGSRFGAPNVSRVFALGVRGPVDRDQLARAEAFYEQRESAITVTTSPWTDPSLFALLAGEYRIAQLDNVLVRSLAKDGTSVEPAVRAPPGVSIARVPRDGAVAWGALVRAGFGAEADDAHAATIDGVFDAPESHTTSLFTASVDGVPAGGAAVTVEDGVAFFFATATVAKYRRRGVQGALVAARLAHARDRGADLALVVTAPGSASEQNLEGRCGFRVAYTQTICVKDRRREISRN